MGSPREAREGSLGAGEEQGAALTGAGEAVRCWEVGPGKEGSPGGQRSRRDVGGRRPSASVGCPLGQCPCSGRGRAFRSLVIQQTLTARLLLAGL